MFFEEELGIRPEEYLRNHQLDAFFEGNRVPVQFWEELAVRQGLHLSLLRVVVAALLAIPVGFVHRFVPTTPGRHMYAALTGIALIYYPFGNQVFAAIASMAVTYTGLLILPRHGAAFAWATAMPLMLLLMERNRHTWASGAVDITGSLMVLLLKQVAVGHNRADGAVSAKKQRSPERARLAVTTTPSPLEYASYMLASGNLLAGPFFELTEYQAFMQRRGEWARCMDAALLPRALRAMALCICYAIGALVLYTGINSRVSAHMLVEPVVNNTPMRLRLLIVFLCGIAKRAQYFFVWALSEAALNVSGFGFNGFKDQEKTVAKYDRYRNTNMVKVETCYSIATVPQYWNVNTGLFLRRYVYERFGKGTAGLAVTQLVSGLWHGLSEGHMLFFLMSIPLFAGSKVIYKQEKRLPDAVWQSTAWKLTKWFFSHVQLNVFCMPFILVHWHDSWSSAKAFYFVPHVFALAIFGLGLVVPPPKAAPMSRPGSASHTHPVVEAGKLATAQEKEL